MSLWSIGDSTKENVNQSKNTTLGMNPDGGSDTNNSKGKIGTNTILESNVARTSSSSSNESRQRLMESGETTLDGREEKHKNIDSIDVLEEKEVMYCSLETEDDGRIATNSVANKNENAIVEVTYGNSQRRFDSDSETSKVSVAHDGRVSWSKSPDQQQQKLQFRYDRRIYEVF